ncbi:hypothetical protein BOO69_02620 [Sulfitobacter alexandrii]|uniref:Uncharacterized protein n=1 Tax=Sulfitobacter alexandrii TaxID=1917485 RepID=A0A1J0WDN3_9RHOB|nr:hypothetical protein [Sulfitobacter alexandrii]APE42431.1 hypothetical protein BOO69_02620 [Sulfitobacter alexandrii]
MQHTLLDQASGKPLATGQTREKIVAFPAVFDDVDTKDICFAKQPVKDRLAQFEDFVGRTHGFITDPGHKRIQEAVIAFGLASRQIFDDRFVVFLSHFGRGGFIDIVNGHGNYPVGQNTARRGQCIRKYAGNRCFTKQAIRSTRICKNCILKVLDRLSGILNHVRRDIVSDIRNRLINRLHLGKNIFHIRRITAKQTAKDTVSKVFDRLYNTLDHFRCDNIRNIRSTIPKQATNNALVPETLIRKVCDSLYGILNQFGRDDFHNIRNRLINRLHLGKHILHIRLITAKQTAKDTVSKVFDSLYNILDHFRCDNIRNSRITIPKQATNNALVTETLIRKVFDSLDGILNRLINRLHLGKNIFHIWRITTKQTAITQDRIDNTVVVQQTTDNAILTEDAVSKVLDRLYDTVNRFRRGYIRRGTTKQATKQAAIAQNRVDNTVVAQQATDNAILTEDAVSKVLDRLYDTVNRFRRGHIRRGTTKQATIAQNRVDNTVVAQQTTDNAILTEDTVSKLLDRLYDTLNRFRSGHIGRGTTKQTTKQAAIAQNRIDHTVVAQQATDNAVLTEDTVSKLLDRLYDTLNRFRSGHIGRGTTKQTTKQVTIAQNRVDNTVVAQQTTDNAILTEDTVSKLLDRLYDTLNRFRSGHIGRGTTKQTTKQAAIAQNRIDHTVVAQQATDNAVLTEDTVNQTTIAQEPANNPVVAKHRVNQTIVAENGNDNAPVTKYARKDTVFAGEHAQRAILAQNGAKHAALAKHTTQHALFTKDTANQAFIPENTVQNPVDQTAITKDAVNQTVIPKNTVHDTIDQATVAENPIDQTVIAKHHVDQATVSKNGLDDAAVAQNARKDAILTDDRVHHAILAQDGAKHAALAKHTTQQVIHKAIIADDRTDTPADNAILTQKAADHPLIVRAGVFFRVGISTGPGQRSGHSTAVGIGLHCNHCIRNGNSSGRICLAGNAENLLIFLERRGGRQVACGSLLPLCTDRIVPGASFGQRRIGLKFGRDTRFGRNIDRAIHRPAAALRLRSGFRDGRDEFTSGQGRRKGKQPVLRRALRGQAHADRASRDCHAGIARPHFAQCLQMGHRNRRTRALILRLSTLVALKLAQLAAP